MQCSPNMYLNLSQVSVVDMTDIDMVLPVGHT